MFLDQAAAAQLTLIIARFSSKWNTARRPILKNSDPLPPPHILLIDMQDRKKTGALYGYIAAISIYRTFLKTHSFAIFSSASF